MRPILIPLPLRYLDGLIPLSRGGPDGAEDVIWSIMHARMWQKNATTRERGKRMLPLENIQRPFQEIKRIYMTFITCIRSRGESCEQYGTCSSYVVEILPVNDYAGKINQITGPRNTASMLYNLI